MENPYSQDVWDNDLFLNYYVRHLNLFKPGVGLKSKEQAAGFKPQMENPSVARALAHHTRLPIITLDCNP